MAGVVHAIQGTTQGVAHLNFHIGTQLFSAHQEHEKQGTRINTHALLRIHFDKANFAILKKGPLQINGFVIKNTFNYRGSKAARQGLGHIQQGATFLHLTQLPARQLPG